jgi:hypothetical protein
MDALLGPAAAPVRELRPVSEDILRYTSPVWGWARSWGSRILLQALI